MKRDIFSEQILLNSTTCFISQCWSTKHTYSFLLPFHSIVISPVRHLWSTIVISKLLALFELFSRTKFCLRWTWVEMLLSLLLEEELKTGRFSVAMWDSL